MNVLSLFTGAGGFDLGLERAGWRTVFQCEIEPNCAQVLQHNWPNVPRSSDVTTLTGEHVLRSAGHVDVVAWGSPCQDLSVAGRRAGLKGKNSHLFAHGTRIIGELRRLTNGKGPTWSIWENVPGALTSNRGRDFGSVLAELEVAGAVFSEWSIVDSQFFGVPQRRRRLFVLSCFNPRVAKRTTDPLLPIATSPARDHRPADLACFYKTHGKQDRAQFGVTPPLKRVSPVCVAGQMVRPRKLTPVEHERLMGWPDGHTAQRADGRVNSDTARYRMCGNGVVAPVATWIAEQINK